jgi:hypothetical protein
MHKREIIIDNSALDIICSIKVIDLTKLIKNIFSKAYIPTEIESEFSRIDRIPIERIKFLEQLDFENNFFVRCSTIEPISHALIKGVKNIDPGEAEAYGQHKKLIHTWILSDDYPFVKEIAKFDKSVKIIDIPYLFAFLDVHQLISNWNECIKQYNNKRRCSSVKLRAAYQSVINDLGLPIEKKKISLKTSLSKILNS